MNRLTTLVTAALFAALTACPGDGGGPDSAPQVPPSKPLTFDHPITQTGDSGDVGLTAEVPLVSAATCQSLLQNKQPLPTECYPFISIAKLPIPKSDDSKTDENKQSGDGKDSGADAKAKTDAQTAKEALCDPNGDGDYSDSTIINKDFFAAVKENYKSIEYYYNSATGLYKMDLFNTLNLFAPNLTSLKGIDCFKALDDVRILSNNMTQLDDFKDMIQLWSLDLANNKITDLSVLIALKKKQTSQGIKGLGGVYLTGNTIKDECQVFRLMEEGVDVLYEFKDYVASAKNCNHSLPYWETDILPDGCVPTNKANLLTAIKDINLENEIRKALGKPAAIDTVSVSDATKLNTLTVKSKEIKDLTGLQCFNKLQILNILDNKVSDLTPLATLTNLTILLANNNAIKNVGALKGLPNLVLVALISNEISDISPLIERGGFAINLSKNPNIKCDAIYKLKANDSGVAYDQCQVKTILAEAKFLPKSTAAKEDAQVHFSFNVQKGQIPPLTGQVDCSGKGGEAAKCGVSISAASVPGSLAEEFADFELMISSSTKTKWLLQSVSVIAKMEDGSEISVYSNPCVSQQTWYKDEYKFSAEDTAICVQVTGKNANTKAFTLELDAKNDSKEVENLNLSFNLPTPNVKTWVGGVVGKNKTLIYKNQTESKTKEKGPRYTISYPITSGTTILEALKVRVFNPGDFDYLYKDSCYFGENAKITLSPMCQKSDDDACGVNSGKLDSNMPRTKGKNCNEIPFIASSGSAGMPLTPQGPIVSSPTCFFDNMDVSVNVDDCHTVVGDDVDSCSQLSAVFKDSKGTVVATSPAQNLKGNNGNRTFNLKMTPKPACVGATLGTVVFTITDCGACDLDYAFQYIYLNKGSIMGASQGGPGGFVGGKTKDVSLPFPGAFTGPSVEVVNPQFGPAK